MRNPPAAFKHADPTHLEFGKSADSSLLAKRRNFVAGGGVEDETRPAVRWGPDGKPEYYDLLTGDVGGPGMATRLGPDGKLQHYSVGTGDIDGMPNKAVDRYGRAYNIGTGQDY